MEQAAEVRCAGGLVRMVHGFATSRIAVRAGRQTGDALADMMLFDAGHDVLSQDLAARFMADELGNLEWLADYLCDEDMVQMFVAVRASDKQLEEDEAPPDDDYYQKSILTSESDIIYDN